MLFLADHDLFQHYLYPRIPPVVQTVGVRLTSDLQLHAAGLIEHVTSTSYKITAQGIQYIDNLYPSEKIQLCIDLLTQIPVYNLSPTGEMLPNTFIISNEKFRKEQ